MSESTGGNRTTYKGEVLAGHHNFLQWRRDVRTQGETLGVLTLFNGNDSDIESIIQEPSVPVRKHVEKKVATQEHIDQVTNELNKHKTYLKQPKTQLPGTDNADVEAKVHNLTLHLESLTTQENYDAQEKAYRKEYKEDIGIHQWESQVYEKQQKRLQRAKELLMDSIDKTIQPMVVSMNPRSIWSYCHNNFRVQQSVAIPMLYAKLAKVQLSNCQNLQDYISQLRNIRMDLSSHGEQMSDIQFLTQVMNGLTPRYNSVVRDTHMKNEEGMIISSEKFIQRLFVNDMIYSTGGNSGNSNTHNGNTNAKSTGDVKNKDKDKDKGKKNSKCPSCKKNHPGGEAE
ncbi:hypothetical protein DM02DRAFT_665577, partial [Periconia macrospinosa]